MSKPVISVERLSKAYRIGLKEEIPDTLVGAVTGILKAPFRNWRRLARLNTFEKPAVSGQRSAVGGNGHAGLAEYRGSRMEDGGGGGAEHRTSNIERPTSNGNGHAPALDSRPSTLDSDTIWALQDVSFEVQEGEVVGIIGRNGAGKSTLLKILSRITEPTSGRAVIRGRVSSLLEVGTGFHPELSGRENVYMNGTILGMTKREIDRKFDEIVDFSGVEKFLDTPVKRYSSGMKVRLAFAVAAHLEPEVLVIDEVLAVGDAEFQQRCMGKMQDVADSGRTVLFVSHNLGAVRTLCHRGLMLVSGAVAFQGQIDDAVDFYLSSFSQGEGTELDDTPQHREGAGDARVTRVEVRNRNGETTGTLAVGAPATFLVEVSRSLRGLACAVRVCDAQGAMISVLNSRNSGPEDTRGLGTQFVCQMDELLLMPGRYRLEVILRTHRDVQDRVPSAAAFDVIGGDVRGRAVKPHRSARCCIPHRWIVPSGDC
jgi:lipopolysaccharide transport system ATP-binding protein